MTKEQQKFLEDLKESGKINMYGAGTYLMDRFGLDKREARTVMIEWMNSYKLIKIT